MLCLDQRQIQGIEKLMSCVRCRGEVGKDGSVSHSSFPSHMTVGSSNDQQNRECKSSIAADPERARFALVLAAVQMEELLPNSTTSREASRVLASVQDGTGTRPKNLDLFLIRQCLVEAAG